MYLLPQLGAATANKINWLRIEISIKMVDWLSTILKATAWNQAGANAP